MNLTSQSLYFSSPQESVKLTSKMLIQENWEKLSKYYFKENSNKETLDSMKNGSYFIRVKKPDIVHPSESWKYKKPFSPNFKYSGHIENEKNIIKVSVNLKIDQGGGMIQEGLSFFYLIRSENGYQLLP